MRHLAKPELKDCDSEFERVDPLVEGKRDGEALLLQKLWSEIRVRSSKMANSRVATHRRAQVRDANAAIATDQNVIGLDVEMEDSALVHLMHALDELSGELELVLGGELVAVVNERVQAHRTALR